ncbi:MAG: hypothetical protein K5666_02060, partial [Bacilli bacterium]|nr:hypothetical protein [Bacilli bacterium]
MKKLKCTSCGGNLEVEDNNEYAKCAYCDTRYKLNEDKTINIKIDDSVAKSFKGMSKYMIIPFVMVFIFVIVIGCIIFKTATKSQTDFDKTRFNNQFIYKNGTQYKV